MPTSNSSAGSRRLISLPLYSPSNSRSWRDEPLSQTSQNTTVELYTRYADDFLIGIIGSKQETVRMFQEVEDFLSTSLKLEVSEAKSGIHHAKEGTAFLGYVVQNYSSEKVVKIHREQFTKVVAIRR